VNNLRLGRCKRCDLTIAIQNVHIFESPSSYCMSYHESPENEIAGRSIFICSLTKNSVIRATLRVIIRKWRWVSCQGFSSCISGHTFLRTAKICDYFWVWTRGISVSLRSKYSGSAYMPRQSHSAIDSTWMTKYHSLWLEQIELSGQTIWERETTHSPVPKIFRNKSFVAWGKTSIKSLSPF
jgi:hypothetical protein